MEQWLINSLIEKGILSADGVGRGARMNRCPSCRKIIIVGLDDDMCAGVARCDPTPLGLWGEVAALLDGLTTYDLAWRARRYELDRRESLNVTWRPAGQCEGFDVLADHRCGRAPQGATASQIKRKPRPAALPDEPPF